MQPGMRLFDIVLAQGACTNSNYAAQYQLGGTFAPIADFGLLEKAVAACRARGLRFRVGNVVSSDVFYNDGGPAASAGWLKMGVLAAEMEAAALYMNAARAGKKALAILTISDLLAGGEETTSEQRETAFTDMMRVALEIA